MWTGPEVAVSPSPRTLRSAFLRRCFKQFPIRSRRGIIRSVRESEFSSYANGLSIESSHVLLSGATLFSKLRRIPEPIAGMLPKYQGAVPPYTHFSSHRSWKNHDWVTLARARVVPRRTRCRRQHAPPNAPPASRWTLCAESDHASPPGSCAGRRRAAEAAPRIGCSPCYDGPTLCAWEGL